jgi:hypothetical protein
MRRYPQKGGHPAAFFLPLILEAQKSNDRENLGLTDAMPPNRIVK